MTALTIGSAKAVGMRTETVRIMGARVVGVIKALVSFGAGGDINVADADGATPAHVAAQEGHMEVGA